MPPELTTAPSWQALVRRAWQLQKPGFRPLEPGEPLYTSDRGPSPMPLDEQPEPAAGFAECRTVALPYLPPVPAGAVRVLDFVHTATEASRVVDGAAVLSASRDHVLFTDDPDCVADSSSPGELFRARISIADDIELLPATTGSRAVVERDSSMQGLVAWLKSMVHSDADLVLVPHIPSKGAMPEVASVTRLQDDRSWDLSSVDGWDGLNLDPMKHADWNQVLLHLNSPLQTWEFRSAGNYLAVCNDCNGFAESTMSCFSAAVSSGTPLWQRRMVGTHGDAGGRGFFYDNDGIAISPAYVCYASRSKKPIPTTTPQTVRPTGLGTRVCAEFHLLSTRTGELLRILSLPGEARLSGPSLCYWTSFAVSETHLAATVGGQHGTRRFFSVPRYGYPHVFVWDFSAAATGASASGSGTTPEQSPTTAIPLPDSWQHDSDAWTTLSADGRFLGVSVGWELAVWDLVRKRTVGRWRVHGRSRFEQQDVEQAFVNLGWNGTWILYRDVFSGTDHCGDAKGEGEGEWEDNHCHCHEQHGVAWLGASRWRAIGRGEQRCPALTAIHLVSQSHGYGHNHGGIADDDDGLNLMSDGDEESEWETADEDEDAMDTDTDEDEEGAGAVAGALWQMYHSTGDAAAVVSGPASPLLPQAAGEAGAVDADNDDDEDVWVDAVEMGDYIEGVGHHTSSSSSS